jgi:hypothetical protein
MTAPLLPLLLDLVEGRAPPPLGRRTLPSVPARPPLHTERKGEREREVEKSREMEREREVGLISSGSGHRREKKYLLQFGYI